jgi:hypothetical protein
MHSSLSHAVDGRTMRNGPQTTNTAATNMDDGDDGLECQVDQWFEESTTFRVSLIASQNKELLEFGRFFAGLSSLESAAILRIRRQSTKRLKGVGRCPLMTSIHPPTKCWRCLHCTLQITRSDSEDISPDSITEWQDPTNKSGTQTKS